MLINLLILLTVTLPLIIPIFPELTYLLLKLIFVVYIALVCLDIYKKHSISLFHTWIGGFIYIIWSDMMICAYGDHSNRYTIPIFFYLIANGLVILGYNIFKGRDKFSTTSYNVRNTSTFGLVLFLLIIAYLILQRDLIIQTLTYGRVLTSTTSGSNIFSILISSIGILLPALIAYYFKYLKKKGIIYSFIFSMPIFAYQFIIATRFKLLFQVLPFFIITNLINIKNIKFKYLLIAITSILLFSLLSSYTKENRGVGRRDSISAGEVEYYEENKDHLYRLAENMSPEGIIYIMSLMDDYFLKHNHTYGQETAYIAYVWIPRRIWKDKPIPLDNWLIRKYENVRDEHSSSSGFMGTLRSDFGWFSLIFALLIGWILRSCDNYINNFYKNKKTNSIDFIFALNLFPFFFFFIRSPITATMHLCFLYITFYILRQLCFNKICYAKASSNKLNC